MWVLAIFAAQILRADLFDKLKAGSAASTANPSCIVSGL
jgi:hypothetical protein